jgi:DNA-binding CsgD family transcriptional regulator
MDMEPVCASPSSSQQTITLLTSNVLLGHLFRHFLDSCAEWKVNLLSPDELDVSDGDLWLLDVSSVDPQRISSILERLLLCGPGALVNASLAEAVRLLERHPDINGVFFSHSSREQLLSGLDTLSRGGVWLPRMVMEHLLLQLRRMRQSAESMAALTAREQEILCLVGKGLSNGEIAEQLCLSPHTIKSHVHNLLGKLGASNRVEAVFLLRNRLGWS